MLITISIVLIIISSLMGLVPKLRKFSQSRSEFFTFALTLMATFIGVFWAIEFNNRNQEKIETDNAIKLLSATKIEVENKIGTNKMYWEIIDKKLTPSTPKEFIQSNPIQLSNLLQITISDELILRKISETGIQELHGCSDDLLSLQHGLNNDAKLKDSLVADLLNMYIKQLKFSIKIIDLEIKYLMNELDGVEVDVEYDSLYSRLKREEKIYDLDSALEQKKKEQ